MIFNWADFKVAFDQVERAVSLRERTLGLEHALTIQAINSKVALLIAEGSAGNFLRADALIVRSLAVIDGLGKAGIPPRIYLLDTRAQLAEARGQLKRAIGDREKVLKLRIQTLGATHTDIAYSHKQIARIAMALGRSAEAAENLQRAQDIYDAAAGHGDLDAIDMRRSRAMLLAKEGNHGKTKEILTEALVRARGGQDTASRVPVLEFEILKLRFVSEEDQSAVLSEVRTLRESAQAPELKELAHEMEQWLKRH